METKINIAAILKDKPQGTKLYSLTYGDCFYQEYTGDFGIECQSQNGVQFNLTESGKYCVEGECILFPSKEMQDWLKFSWNKGDVLQHSEYPLTVIFESFVDDTYTSFKCKYNFDFESASKWLVSNSQCSTKHFYKVSEEEAKEFIKKVELNFNGKLNMETLEIEEPEFKDGDIVTIMPRIGDKLIYLFKAEDNEKYYGHAFLDGNIAIVNDDSYCQKDFCTARPSTEKEKQQFLEALAKKHIYWDCEHKKILYMSIKVELKPFDRVLVRDHDNEVWRANLFSNYTSDGSYGCVCGAYNQCIPYNEETEKLIGTTNNVEG